MALLKSYALQLEELRSIEADACYDQLNQWAVDCGALKHNPVTRQSSLRDGRQSTRWRQYNIILEPLDTIVAFEATKPFGYDNSKRLTGKRHRLWSEL